jgi:hypothetical protein
MHDGAGPVLSEERHHFRKEAEFIRLIVTISAGLSIFDPIAMAGNMLPLTAIGGNR